MNVDKVPKQLLGLVAMMTVVTHLRADNLPMTKQDALHEISSEAAQCASYYVIAQKCVENSNRADISDQSQRAIDTAQRIEFTSGKAAGMSDQAILASFKLSLESLDSSIRSSCLNISIIIEKYAYSCKGLLEHPDSRLQALVLGAPPLTSE